METAEQTSANSGAQNTTATQSAQQPATDGANSGSSNGARTFTQEEVDKGTGKARQEGRVSGVNDLFKKLGVASEDDLKTLIAEAQTLKQSQMTESEKKQADLDKAAKTIADLQAKLDQQTAMIRERDIQGAVKSAVAALKGADFDAIYLWAEKHHTDALNAILDTDGKVDTKAVERLIEAVKKDKPTFFLFTGAQAAGSQSNANGRVLSSDVEAQKRASQTNQRIIRGR